MRKGVPLPVVVLQSGAPSAARERTLASLRAQSVQTTPHASLQALASADSEYVALVLAGTVLDATACERAVWFLASRERVPCVTGAATTPAADAPLFASLQQFVVARRAHAVQLLSADAVPHGATAIALALALCKQSGRGAGWIAEPVIREQADAGAVAAIDREARAALRQLDLDEARVIDLGLSGLPVSPVQRLQRVDWPDVQVVHQPGTGMRVLVLLQGFPMGGYTAFNADLLPRLAARGHVITTCTTEFWRSDWRQEIVRASSPDMHHAHAVVPPAAVPAYIDWLVTTREIDVVLLSHSFLGFHLLPYLRARHPGVAFVDYVHTDWFESAMYGSYAEMAARWESQLDAQLATSAALVAHLVERGCDADATHPAHIGIDTAAWHHEGARLASVRSSLGATPETLVVLFSGRIAPEKRPHLAVDSAAQLIADGHDVVLVFAGSGQLLQATHERAAARGIEARCKFLGEVDEATLKLVYAASDVLLAPSEIEGIARSLYEAMAMGCVPVVSDVGGQRELVVAGAGSLVDATTGDAAPYVAALRPWFDRATRQRASAVARSHIEAQFDSHRTVDLVHEALQRGRARRTGRQHVLPPAMAEELAVLAVDVIRRHMLRHVNR